MKKPSKHIRSLSIAVTAIAVSCGIASAATIPISKAVGVVQGTAPDGTAAAYTFVVGGDGNLWLNIFSNTDYSLNYATGSWGNQGVPASGVTLTVPVGITGGPLAFVIGSDGNVYARQWYNGNWLWLNTGKPSGVTLTAGYGATHNGGGNPMAFLQGSDGNVWQDYWNGSSWVWYNLSHPSVSLNSGLGATEDGGGRPYAFFVGSDANLWELYYDGSGWEWNNEGHPSTYAVTGPIGATAETGTGGTATPVAFVNTSYGQWEFVPPSTWVSTGPTSFGLTMPLGAAGQPSGSNAGLPYFEAFGDSPTGGIALFRVWLNLSGDTWGGANVGSMPNTGPAFPVGVFSAQNYFDGFVIGTDGNLWVGYDGNSYPTGWVNLGTPKSGGGGGGGGGCPLC